MLGFFAIHVKALTIRPALLQFLRYSGAGFRDGGDRGHVHVGLSDADPAALFGQQIALNPTAHGSGRECILARNVIMQRRRQ